MREARIESGIEMVMMSVLRQLPRNKSIMSAVSAAAITASRTTPEMAAAHENGLIADRVDLHRRRELFANLRQAILDALDDVERGRVSGLEDALQHRPMTVAGARCWFAADSRRARARRRARRSRCRCGS